ncbi:MAG: ribonuclease III [Bacilli bacterium]
MRPIQELLNQLQIQPRNLGLYQLAFTHTSVNANGKSIGKDYERLEFMGDACISMVVADLVFRLHPEWSQGELSKTRAKFVQTNSLVVIARQLHISEYVTIGPSIKREMVEQSDKILEDIFEAFIGAIYLDLGFEKAYTFVSDFFRPLVMEVSMDDLTDYKTRLQEEMQAEFREAVSYEKVDESGPAHDKSFTYQVSFNGIVLGTGTGPSKKKAEQAAAKQALEKKVIK